MRKGWEYKRLGEVCTIERGGSPRPINDYITDSEDGINWIKIGDAQEGSKYITSTKEKIKPEGVKKSRFVHKGDFILSNSMSFGRPYILKVDGCIHDGWLVIHDNNDIFIKDYLYYLLASPTMYAKFSQLAVGGVVNNLNSSLVRKVEITIPPKSTQLAIVSELDKINELIRLKKEQLKDFDNLAQSLFYEMFGDPVENEKGWEVKKLGEICEVVTGTTPKTNIPEYWGKGHYWVTPAELNDTAVYIDRTERKITDEALSKTKLRLLPVGTVLLSSRAPIGKVAITKVEMYCNQGFKNCICSDSIYNKYLFYFLRMMKEYLNSLGRGATFKEISKSIVESIRIPLPPLTLQHLFAQRVEQIEREKSVVQKSIQDLETLLASRMQYWFE